jgi:hypothetical protein
VVNPGTNALSTRRHSIRSGGVPAGYLAWAITTGVAVLVAFALNPACSPSQPRSMETPHPSGRPELPTGVLESVCHALRCSGHGIR